MDKLNLNKNYKIIKKKEKNSISYTGISYLCSAFCV